MARGLVKKFLQNFFWPYFFIFQIISQINLINISISLLWHNFLAGTAKKNFNPREK